MNKRFVVVLGLGLGLARAEAAEAQVLKPGAIAKTVPEMSEPGAADLKKLRAALAGTDAKVQPILRADPRVAGLIKALSEAADLDDATARQKRFTELSGQVNAVRSEAMKKAGVVEADLQAAKQIKRASIVPIAAALKPAGSVISTVEVSSFPLTFSGRSGCPESSTKIDFDGNTVKLRAESSFQKHDCGTVTVGRAASVQVPSGAKKVKVVIRAKVKLNAYATAFGTYAHAGASFGARIFSPSGVTLDTWDVGSQKLDVPVKATTLRAVSAENFFPNPIPHSSSSFEDTIQAGDEYSVANYDLPSNVGSTLEFGIFVQAWATAAAAGIAIGKPEVTPQGLTITFFR